MKVSRQCPLVLLAEATNFSQYDLNYSVRTSKKTRRVSMTAINWKTLFREIIAVHSENHMKHINKLCGQNIELLIVKAGGHCDLNG
jgi:hypothetical protein